jgi:hypothetical protein
MALAASAMRFAADVSGEVADGSSFDEGVAVAALSAPSFAALTNRPPWPLA